MPIIRKISPKGIDRPIDRLEVDLFDGLDWDNLPGVTYESNHRAYRNETSKGIKPEIFNGSGEYRDVYLDDNVSANSFFLVDDLRTGDKKYTTDISVIFQLKLDKIFPLITHRAGEEAHVAVLDILERNTTQAKIKELITGISNVYAGLQVEQVRFDDMQPFHVFRVDMSINFENC